MIPQTLVYDRVGETRPVEHLEEYVTLVATYFSRWRGVYQLPKHLVDVTVDGRAIDDVTVPRIRLLTDTFPSDASGTPWLERFRAVERSLKASIERCSVPFPIRGVRIVPLSYEKRLFDAVAEAKQTLANVVDEFVTALPDVMIQIYEHVGAEILQYVAPKIPQNEEAMRKKFGIGVVPVKLAPLSHQNGAAERGETGELNTRWQTLDLDTLNSHWTMVRDTVEAAVRDAIESMISGPREELAAALRNLDNLIQKSGRITQRTFAPIERAIEKLRAFSFVGNEALLQQLQQFETRLRDTEPRDLVDNEAVRISFRNVLTALLDEAEDEVKAAADAERFGRFSRTVQI